MTSSVRSDRPRFVSHRGFRPLAPDNSLPGFGYAGLLGQWAIETDVRATRDGVLVCCHDATVDALFDGDGVVAEMTWAELSRLRLNTGPRLECYRSEDLRMPLLAEYLRMCKAAGSIAFIELKVAEVDAVLRTVRECGLTDDEVIISSSQLPWLEETRAAAPGVFVHHIFSNDEAIERLARLGNAGVSLKVEDPDTLPADAIARVHDRGVQVCLRAADDLTTVTRMQQLGLDYLPTNSMHNPIAGRSSHGASDTVPG